MKITTKELTDLVIDVLKARLVPMIHGSPGIGKSDIIKEIAKRFKLYVIDVRLSQSDPTDMSGFPALTKDKTRSTYLPMETFPIEGDIVPDGYKGWLLFFDEFNSSPPSVQAAAYKIILDKMIGLHHLHSKVSIVCAGNLATDKAIVNRLSTAMQSRLIHFELEVNQPAWIKWATEAEIDYRIISFIGYKTTALQNFDPNHTDHTFACGRTWEFASKLIKHYDVIPGEKIPLLAGTVGEAAGREFYTYSQIFPDLIKIKDIIKDPEGIPIPSEPSVRFALAGTIGSQINPDNADKLMPFIARLDPEFMILTLQGMHKKHPMLYNIPSVKKWMAKYANEFYGE